MKAILKTAKNNVRFDYGLKHQFLIKIITKFSHKQRQLMILLILLPVNFMLMSNTPQCQLSQLSKRCLFVN